MKGFKLSATSVFICCSACSGSKTGLKRSLNFLVLREIYVLIQLMFHNTASQNEDHGLKFIDSGSQTLFIA